MEYRSSIQADNSQSWYFSELEDSRLNIIPSNTTIVDPQNSNRIITGGGALSDSGSNLVTTFEILTTSGYDETKIIADHNQAKAQGFMMLPTDWQNFEITGYFHFIDTNPGSRVELFGRSGRHINGRPCEGTKYDLVVTSDGHLRGNVKHFHSAGLQFLHDVVVLGDLEGERIGIKFVVYNNSYDVNPTAVRIEAYVDRFVNNIWDKVYDFTDTGSSNIYLKCGDSSTNMITWGGPIVGIRVIDFPSGGLGIEKLSVREVDALLPKVVIPQPEAPFDPEAVSAPVAPPSDDYNDDLTDDDWDDDTDYPLPPWGDPGDNPPPP